MRNVAVFAVAAVLVAGAGARAQAAMTPQIVCHSHISRDGEIRQEPYLQISPPPVWRAARNFLVAPISGVGVLAGRALGMKSCAGPPLLVMFWLPPRTSGGGSTLGDVFVAWMPPAETSGPLSVDGYVMEGQRVYLRYGPNISQTRVDEEELGYHESRHVDQWAVANLLAGPFAFPVAYFADGALFPSSRNHFERDAGLARGGYPPVQDNWPAPRWPETAVWTLVVLVIVWRRVRWLTRALLGGLGQVRAHEPGRCPVHTRGWSPWAPQVANRSAR